MKKYILLTLILTVVVVGPFVYQQWSEAKRLQHIRETKQLAAQIQATSFENIPCLHRHLLLCETFHSEFGQYSVGSRDKHL